MATDCCLQCAPPSSGDNPMHSGPGHSACAATAPLSPAACPAHGATGAATTSRRHRPAAQASQPTHFWSRRTRWTTATRELRWRRALFKDDSNHSTGSERPGPFLVVPDAVSLFLAPTEKDVALWGRAAGSCTFHAALHFRIGHAAVCLGRRTRGDIRSHGILRCGRLCRIWHSLRMRQTGQDNQPCCGSNH